MEKMEQDDAYSLVRAILGIIVGVVALVASSRVKDEAIVMAMLGILVWCLGGVLVAIGGIWALVTRYTHKQS